MPRDALIVVDVQNDFCPGGALPVPDGDQVVPIINRLMPLFPLVVATQDWHPWIIRVSQQTIQTADRGQVIEVAGMPQVLWPVHCVQGTAGADFHRGFDVTRIQKVIRKGSDPTIDSYSGFFDNARRRTTDLHPFLQMQGVQRIFVCGLATDYCVKHTCLDGRSLGYEVYLIEDACRGVNLSPGDVQRAIDQMRCEGVEVVQSGDVARLLSRQ